MFMKTFLKRWFGVTTQKQAEVISRKIAIVYAIIGWNCFGFLFYSIMKNRIPEDAKERRLAFRSLASGSGNLQVYQIKGFRLSNKFDIEHDDEDIYEEGKETE